MVIGLTFVTGLIVARSVGPAGKGALTLLASCVTLASVIAGFGFSVSGVHLYRARKLRLGSIVGISGLFWLPPLVIGALLLAVSGDGITRFLPDMIGKEAVSLAWFWLAFATLPALLLSTFIQGILLVDNRMRVYAWLTIGSQLVGFVFVWVLVVVCDRGVTGALIANVAAQTLSAVIGVGWLRSMGPAGSPEVSRSAVVTVVRSSRGPYLNGLVANAFKHGEGILLAALIDIRSVGHYGVALAFYTLLTEAPRAVVWPLVGRMTENGRNPSEEAARSLRVVPVVMIAPVVAMAALSPLVIPLFYGTVFAPAGILLAWMAPGVLFRSVHLVVYSYLVVTGEVGKIVTAVGGAAAANLLLDIALAPRWGLAGVALSNVIAELLLALFSIMIFLSHTQTGVRSIFVKRSDLHDLRRNLTRMVMSWK